MCDQNVLEFPYQFPDNFKKNLLILWHDNKTYYLRKINDVLRDIKEYYYIDYVV